MVSDNDFRLYESYLAHYGVKGMHWGIRRYQNSDGSLTTEGKKRYSKNSILIPSGTKMYRAAHTDSHDFLNRKYTYVNITDDYSIHNMNTSEGFDFKSFNYDHEMVSKKPLKIATLNKYYSVLNKKYGLDRILKDEISLHNIKDQDIQRGKKIVQEILDWKYIEGDSGNKSYMNYVVDELMKAGYNGVIDPIDGAHQDKRREDVVAAILFSPKDNVKLKETFCR